MLIHLDIGSLEIEGLNNISETQLQTAINETMQVLMEQHHLSAQMMQIDQLQFDEMSFQIDADGSVQEVAQQIATGILQQLPLLE